MNQLYLYGFVKSERQISLGSIGIHSEGEAGEVKTVSKQGYQIIYSDVALEEGDTLVATRKNLVTHQKVIEELVKDHTLIPCSFGTVQPDLVAAEGLLQDQISAFDQVLNQIEGCLEFGIKLVWQDMEAVFNKVSSENLSVRSKREELSGKGELSQNDKIELGQLVEQALIQKKQTIEEEVIQLLSPVVKDHRLLKLISDAMITNIAVLITRDQEQELDEAVNKVSEALEHENITIKYVGPSAAYNFISFKNNE